MSVAPCDVPHVTRARPTQDTLHRSLNSLFEQQSSSQASAVVAAIVEVLPVLVETVVELAAGGALARHERARRHVVTAAARVAEVVRRPALSVLVKRSPVPAALDGKTHWFDNGGEVRRNEAEKNPQN